MTVISIGQAPMILATVGSDHHPFHRLIEWLDGYLAGLGSENLRYVCQYGTAHPPVFGMHRPFLKHDDLHGLLTQASAVVCHGGPGSIFDSLRIGRIPIVVPRLCRYGEAVDDHQNAFCSLMAKRQQAVLATTEHDLHDSLDRVLQKPENFVAPASTGDDDRATAVQAFADVVAQYPPSRRGRLLTGNRLFRP